jgi:diketogulonate reductase-like aldo/keto reductase
MEELKAAGLARSIGVSNYLPEHLDWLLETATTPPSINQIEFHPYLQHAGLIDYHKKHVRLDIPLFQPNKRNPQPPALSHATATNT